MTHKKSKWQEIVKGKAKINKAKTNSPKETQLKKNQGN